MAKPIAATPVLTGKEAIRFVAKMHENAKKPVGPIPTPKLGEAEELIKQSQLNPHNALYKTKQQLSKHISKVDLSKHGSSEERTNHIIELNNSFNDLRRRANTTRIREE
jgi:hypothetical protein